MYFSSGESVCQPSGGRQSPQRQGHGLNDLFKPYLPRMDPDEERRPLEINGQRLLVLLRPLFPSRLGKSLKERRQSLAPRW